MGSFLKPQNIDRIPRKTLTIEARVQFCWVGDKFIVEGTCFLATDDLDGDL